MKILFGELWRQPEFLKLWLGQAVSEFGSRISREGLPLTAVLLLAASPGQMGLLAAIGSAPVLVIGLLAGVWVDRLYRRPILIIADLGRALVLSYVPVAAFVGILHVEQLYIIAALVGVLTVFFEIADQAFMPVLISREYILEGNSKRETTASLAEIVGPALTGILVQILTAPIAIIIDCLSFVFSAVCLSSIKVIEPKPKPIVERQSMVREAKAGLGVILSNPLLRALTFCSATRSFFGNFLATLYVLYAIQTLGLTPAVLGVLIGMGGVGALLGSVLAGPIARRFGLGRTMLGSSLLAGFISFLLPLAGTTIFWPVGCLAISQLLADMLMQVYDINTLSLRQQLVPDELLGRANATTHFLVGGLGAVGALVAGVLAENIGVRATIWVSVVGMLLSATWLIFSPVITNQITKPDLALQK